MPGSDKHYHCFFDLEIDEIVSIDIAGALFQFAAQNLNDYLRGNHNPSVSWIFRWLSYLRSICRWKMKIFFDGMENPHKSYEAQWCQDDWDDASATNNSSRQVRNSPEHIFKACAICYFLEIDFEVAPHEADPQATLFSEKTILF